jgi:CRISPR/Cas system-associated protein Cas10 (large subunit of type III CRISPR-Cas system)
MIEGSSELNLLEQVLEGRSEGFKAKVLNLVLRYHWDVNDPNFLILVATGQMEVLLDRFPDQFEQILEQAILRLEQQRSALTELIQGAEFSSSNRTAGFAEQVTALEKLLVAERQRSATDAQDLLKLSETEKQRILAELTQRVKQLSLESQRVTEQKARQLVESTGDAFRRQYYLESMAWVFLSALAILIMGVGLGWMMRDRDLQAFKNTPNVWFGQKLVEWNGRQIKACQESDRRTCELRIEKPEGASN